MKVLLSFTSILRFDMKQQQSTDPNQVAAAIQKECVW